MKTIGETFGQELAAAGCNDGVAFTIGGTDADLVFNDQITPAQKNAVFVVVAAHDPMAKLLFIENTNGS